MFFTKRIIPILLFVLTISYIHAQEVRVRNVTFTQMDELIIIRYDLDGQPNKKYKINLSLSDNFGVTFRIKPKALRGNAGKNITPGNGKEIIWEMTEDYPNGLYARIGGFFVMKYNKQLKVKDEQPKEYYLSPFSTCTCWNNMRYRQL